MREDWLARWAEGRIGWHEPDGNAGLRKHWPDIPKPARVLVPLCGKSPDLLWLARCGYEVAGVELSEVAIEQFFADHDLAFERNDEGLLASFSACELPLVLWCGDYFQFQSTKFDALYDRAALVAVPKEQRPRYIEHTRSLLTNNSLRLVVTLEYDQSIVSGPPYAVPAVEIGGYWNDMVRVAETSGIDNCPPKFRKAGLTDVREVVWRSGS